MLTVAPAQPQDMRAIAELVEGLDRFYGVIEFEPIDRRIAQIEATLFHDQPAAYVLLAHDDGKVIGLAAYSFLWPAAGVTRSLYLKELYVTADHQRRGVGTALLHHVREVAEKTGCSRVEWTTDYDNPQAQRFYEKLGFSTQHGKIFYRISLAVEARRCGAGRVG